jgi:CBS domain-containing membrane protein
MIATSKPFLALTAADLMTPDVVLVPRAMSMRAASHILSEAGVSGAPVVDEAGKCVGVLSTTDFMHWVGYEGRCDCTHVSQDPGCFHSAWQLMDLGDVPLDEVASQMTADPVTVAPGTSIAKLARAMIDAHIHRIIVVDAHRRPIGIVSSTDVVAAVANAGR